MQAEKNTFYLGIETSNCDVLTFCWSRSGIFPLNWKDISIFGLMNIELKLQRGFNIIRTKQLLKAVNTCSQSPKNSRSHDSFENPKLIKVIP